MLYNCQAMQPESFDNVRSAQQRIEADRALDLIICKAEGARFWEICERRNLMGQSWCIRIGSNRREAERRLLAINTEVVRNEEFRKQSVDKKR